MDASRFDARVRSFAAPSRRGFVRGLAAVSGLGAVGIAGRIEAKKKKKKLKKNAFGRVDAGKACRGKDSNCCSSICQGKKPKKGKKDTSRCVAHNVLGCLAEQDNRVVTPNACGSGGSCFRTTGNASFCGNGAKCVSCAHDIECESIAGAGAACVVCPSACPGTTTACMPAVAA